MYSKFSLVLTRTNLFPNFILSRNLILLQTPAEKKPEQSSDKQTGAQPPIGSDSAVTPAVTPRPRPSALPLAASALPQVTRQYSEALHLSSQAFHLYKQHRFLQRTVFVPNNDQIEPAFKMLNRYLIYFCTQISQFPYSITSYFFLNFR